MDDCLIVIPARGGSKGIPNKNMTLIDGIPLVEFSIRSALRADINARICLSTDSPKIRDFGLSCGAEAPFLRPAELSSDFISSADVVKHAIKWYEENECYTPKYVMLLQPTSPLRSPESIREALSKISSSDEVSSLIGVNEPSLHPCEYITKHGSTFKYVMEPPTIPGRQNYPTVYFINGAMYICSIDFIKEHGVMYDEHAELYMMDEDESIDIDEPTDILFTEFMFKRNRSKYYWI